jgi:hypothetical protein
MPCSHLSHCQVGRGQAPLELREQHFLGCCQQAAALRRRCLAPGSSSCCRSGACGGCCSIDEAAEALAGGVTQRQVICTAGKAGKAS